MEVQALEGLIEERYFSLLAKIGSDEDTIGYRMAKSLGLGTPLVYRRLSLLEKNGLLISKLEFPDGKYSQRVRRYRVTEAGWEAVRKYGVWIHSRLAEVKTLYDLRPREEGP